MYGPDTNNRLSRDDAMRQFESELWGGRNFDDVYSLLQVLSGRGSGVYSVGSPSTDALRDLHYPKDAQEGNRAERDRQENANPDRFMRRAIEDDRRHMENGDPDHNAYHDMKPGPLTEFATMSPEQWHRRSRAIGQHRK